MRSVGTWLLCALLVGSAMTVSLTAAGEKSIDNSTMDVDIQANTYQGSPYEGQDVFIPGDPIVAKVTGDCFGNPLPCADTPTDLEDRFDVRVVEGIGAGNCNALTNEKTALQKNDLSMVNGDATYEITGDQSKFLADGDYTICVGDDQWIGGGPTSILQWDAFTIRLFYVELIGDRGLNYGAFGIISNGGTYLPGDSVTIYYAVRNVKDGSIVDIPYQDKEWDMRSSDGQTSPPSVRDLPGPSGSVSFTVSGSGGKWPLASYWFEFWFNGTTDAALRWWDTGNVFIFVDSLQVTVGLDRGTYPPGAVVEVTVSARAGAAGGGSSWPESGVELNLDVLESTGAEMSAYSNKEQTTGPAGSWVYTFQMGSEFADGKTYSVKVEGIKALEKDETTVTFNVQAAGRPITVVLKTDKGYYVSGDTAHITVETTVPAGRSQELTYVYSVSYPSIPPGSVVYREIKKNAATFDYPIPSGFEGTISFTVDVFNADGDSGTAATPTLQVVFAVLTANANPMWYNPGDTVQFTYAIQSTQSLSPTYYYRIWNVAMAAPGCAGAGQPLEEGTTSGGTQSYQIPQAPSTVYGFEILAFVSGRTLVSCVTVNQRAGWVLSFTMDRASFAPGETVTLHYTITTQGNSQLSSQVLLTYGISNGLPSTTLISPPQPNSVSGDVAFKLPNAIDEGDVPVYLTATPPGGLPGVGSFGVAVEIITIRGTNPLWYTAPGDIPIFDWILLILIIVLFLMMFMMRRRAAGAPSGPTPAPAAPMSPAPPPPPGAAPMMTINCKACGAPIEITTSRRPIEVMCPSCGETEMVQ